MTDLTAVILAGGRGTRLASLYPDLPKPMVPCHGAPFIEWVIRYLQSQGVREFVVSLGHLAPIALAYFARRPPDPLASIRPVVERTPLGTGGGIAFAWDAAPGADILVTNGDSLLAADLAPAFRAFARDDTDGVIIATPVADTSRFGSLDAAPDGRLRAFAEKRPGAGLINAGIYLFKSRLRPDFGPADGPPRSIEKDVFPAMLASGRRIAVIPAKGEFLDIGTPESVAQAPAFLDRVFGPGAARAVPAGTEAPA